MSSAAAERLHPAAIVVLAAGAGTRMKSSLPKVLHPVAGKSLLGHVLASARALAPDRLCVVVRHQRDAVVEHALAADPDLVVADQDDIPGTGRAVQCALDMLGELHGPVIVTAGDTPLLDADELAGLLQAHGRAGNDITVLSAHVPAPTGYGRVLREGERVTGIVEEKDATDAQRAVTEINTATYVFDADLLRDALTRVDRNNAQGEVYLTDVIAIAVGAGRKVGAHLLAEAISAEGANDRSQLAALGAEINRRTLLAFMRAGVTIVDPDTTRIDVDVSVGADTTIHPGCQLHGATSVGAGTEIGPDTTLIDTVVGDRATLIRTHANLAVVDEDAHVGPFVNLGPDSHVGAGERIYPFSDIHAITAQVQEDPQS